LKTDHICSRRNQPMLDSTTYSECRALDASFDEALARTRTALADEGFGVLSGRPNRDL